MNRPVDRQSDLYSLGVTFYQMLTGRLPFVAEDLVGWVHAHIARTPAPVPLQLVPPGPPRSYATSSSSCSRRSRRSATRAPPG